MDRRKREDARKTALDRLVEKLEAHADEILDTYPEAIRGGDWRAAEALYDRVYGRSTQRHEVETPARLLPETREAMVPNCLPWRPSTGARRSGTSTRWRAG